MNYKPDEATLIAYLYGELEEGDQIKVAEYLQKNPEERKRLEEWSFTKSVMAHLHDKEVIAPPIIFGEDSNHVPLWKENYFRMSLGIAASLLFFMVAARLLGLSASYSPGEFKIGFGMREKSATKEVPMLTEQQVSKMIQSSVAINNEALETSWQQERKSLEQSIQKNLHSNSLKLDQLMQTTSAASQEQVRSFVGQLQSDNLKLMKDYMQLSAKGQKEYVESLLVDFSKYLDEQRKQDLHFLQARVNKVEQNTDQFKQETEQILTSLITNTSTNNQRRN